MALCQEAQALGPEDLPAAESRWGECLRLREAIRDREEQVLDHSGGRSLGEVEREAAEVDRDAIPGRLLEIVSQLEQLEAARSRLDQQIGQERGFLDLMNGGDAAAAQAEKEHQILAELYDQAQCYARLRAAAALLRGEIKRYRERNQEPVLQRASELFRQLTLGSFAELVSDFNDKDEPVLVGVRPSGEQVRVEGMSDGTCDQLYLALRLASLERYLVSNEPMPFIVDDILIRFDDERAAAALQVLADLSSTTQVIFFTHHARLVDLAKTISGSERAAIQYLRS